MLHDWAVDGALALAEFDAPVRLERKVDPVEVFGILPDTPLPHFGWGAIPDQYGRGWDGDDGESPVPPDPLLAEQQPRQFGSPFVDDAPNASGG